MSDVVPIADIDTPYARNDPRDTRDVTVNAPRFTEDGTSQWQLVPESEAPDCGSDRLLWQRDYLQQPEGAAGFTYTAIRVTIDARTTELVTIGDSPDIYIFRRQ